MDCGDLKDKLCKALMENQKLRKQLGGFPPKEEIYEKDDCLKRQNADLERRLNDAEREIEDLRPIVEEHRHCCNTFPKPASPAPLVQSNQRVVSPVPSRKAPTETVLKSPRVTPKPSSYRVEEQSYEPPKQPIMVIVSKHEFDSVLMQKRKMYADSDVVLPTQGRETLNCRMDICVYDLEMDNHLLDQLSNLERDPYVFVVWSFLGLEQRTVAMPASQAQFCTNVTYFGPVTDPMAQHVKERELKILLMLERTNGRESQVGEGMVNLVPALQQPSRSFVRCVTLHSDLGGSANIYVSFKLSECCPSNEPPAVGEALEVGIGRLQLNKNIPSNATHLYVEYSLLGHCGSQLETDSVPKSEIMRFNHTKRLKVNEENAGRLVPLLQVPDTYPLRFHLMAEPCDLSEVTEVHPIGHAEVNLVQEMVQKDQDLISKEVPVFNNEGDLLGKLSVTIIGISTLQNRMPK